MTTQLTEHLVNSPYLIVAFAVTLVGLSAALLAYACVEDPADHPDTVLMARCLAVVGALGIAWPLLLAAMAGWVVAHAVRIEASSRAVMKEHEAEMAASLVAHEEAKRAARLRGELI
jgi:hypothetical protein